MDCGLNWTADQLVKWLEQQGMVSVVDKFKDINGETFCSLTSESLKELGILNEEERRKCLECVIKFRKQLELCKSKVFQDPIHGSIELHPLLVKIIDTPQFQRLRDIKQLGGVYHVYPGASHNRFEHSIGVCYLAGEMIDSLARRQPELNIDDCDILCVKIAALCHDMGHGPYSHLYQDLFIQEYHRGWKHEEASVMLMDYMMETNEGLKDHFKYYGLDWSRDDTKCFISELIWGKPEKGGHFKGRGDSKRFLYEIVANKMNGIDVDKMDYLLRDSYGLGIKVHFDWKRYIKFARVIEADGVPHICVRSKMVKDIYELFNIRDRLFRVAYQHKTKRAIEFMLCEAMKMVNDIITLPGKDGKPVRMSDAIDDMKAFTKLTDSIFHMIGIMNAIGDQPGSTTQGSLEENEYSDDTNPHQNKADQAWLIKKSQRILADVEKRKLYMYIGKSYPSNEHQSPLDCWSEEIVRAALEENGSLDLDSTKCFVEIVDFDYGAGENNPVTKVLFYEKDSPDTAVKIKQESVSSFLPYKYKEREHRVYYMQYYPDALKPLKKGFATFRLHNRTLTLDHKPPESHDQCVCGVCVHRND